MFVLFNLMTHYLRLRTIEIVRRLILLRRTRHLKH